MSKLTSYVKCPEQFFYLLELVYATPVAQRQFYCRFPTLAGCWPDVSEYSPDDLDEIETCLSQLRIEWQVSDMTKSVPDDDDAA